MDRAWSTVPAEGVHEVTETGTACFLHGVEPLVPTWRFGQTAGSQRDSTWGHSMTSGAMDWELLPASIASCVHINGHIAAPGVNRDLVSNGEERRACKARTAAD